LLVTVTVLGSGCAAEGLTEAAPVQPTREARSGARSAARAPGESYADIVDAHRGDLVGKADGLATAYESRVAMDQLDLEAVPEWSADELASGFRLLRDTRFLQEDAHPEFPRRPSYLYPDDGCFARAEAVSYLLELEGYARPASVFAFGDLRVSTSNSPYGEVQWWFHIAPIVLVDGQAYVLDPSIDPSGPLTHDAWAATQSSEPIEMAVCSGYSYMAEDACERTRPDDVDTPAYADQVPFLQYEWERQRELGRDPELVLGDTPPWTTN
jgi:hypothetical protein